MLSRSSPNRNLLLAIAVILVVTHVPAAGQAVRSFQCGRDIVLSTSVGRPPGSGLQPVLNKQVGASANILLEAGPGLAANPAALAAWENAVSIWESRLHDPVTIVIAGNLQPLPPNVLGSTSSRTFIGDYEEIRNAVVADAAVDEVVATQLPDLQNFEILLPPGFGFPNQLTATKANLKALGFDMSFDDATPDATILFATGFLDDFDFDPSDGIDSNKIDFEAVVVHEIGHALGFSSRVDQVDFLRSEGQTGSVRPSTLDLFRFLPGQGADDFTFNSRLLQSGDLASQHVFFDGFEELELSTGVNLGDGRQASHWKDDQITGVFIGIMDPALPSGVREELTDNDIRAFGLIGWDVVDPPATDVTEDGLLPALVVLRNVYPNPFNPRTNIAFELERTGSVKLELYDVRGRRVRTLVNDYRTAGRHEAPWDGKDDNARQVPSGIYLLRLEAFGVVVQRQIMLVK